MTGEMKAPSAGRGAGLRGLSQLYRSRRPQLPAQPRAGGRAPRPPPHLLRAEPLRLRPAPARPQPHLCSAPAHPRTPARTPSPGCGWPAADPARSRPWLPAPRSARAPRGSGSRPARRGGVGGVPSLGLCAVLWRRRLRSLALGSASVSLGPAVALGSLSPLAPGPLALRRSRLAFPPPHPSAPLLPQPAPARRRRRLLSGVPGRAGSPPLSLPPPPPGASSAPRLQPAGPGGPPTTARAGREPERGTEEAGRRLRPAARRPPCASELKAERAAAAGRPPGRPKLGRSPTLR